MANQSAPPADAGNPMAMDGLEFVEFAAADPQALGALFERMGFRLAGRHRSKAVTLYRQGDINFIVNAELESLPESFAAMDHPAVCAVALRVADAGAAYRRALSLGAWEADAQPGMMELRIPGVAGVGDTTLYLIDRYGEHSIYDVDFRLFAPATTGVPDLGLTAVSELGHRVGAGRSGEWIGFYRHLFAFSAPRQQSGGAGQVMRSPCGRFMIGIREDAAVGDDAEGIDRIVLASADLDASLGGLAGTGIAWEGEGGMQPGRLVRLRTGAEPPAFELVQTRSAGR